MNFHLERSHHRSTSKLTQPCNRAPLRIFRLKLSKPSVPWPSFPEVCLVHLSTHFSNAQLPAWEAVLRLLGQGTPALTSLVWFLLLAHLAVSAIGTGLKNGRGISAGIIPCWHFRVGLSDNGQTLRLLEIMETFPSPYTCWIKTCHVRNLQRRRTTEVAASIKPAGSSLSPARRINSTLHSSCWHAVGLL